MRRGDEFRGVAIATAPLQKVLRRSRAESHTQETPAAGFYAGFTPKCVTFSDISPADLDAGVVTDSDITQLAGVDCRRTL